MRQVVGVLTLACAIVTSLGEESTMTSASTKVERRLIDNFDSTTYSYLSTDDFNTLKSFFDLLNPTQSAPVCYVEKNDFFDTEPRAMPYYAGRGDDFNTADKCLVACLLEGYPVSGVSLYETCFCADEEGYSVNGNTITYDEYGVDSSCSCDSLTSLGSGEICVTILANTYEYVGCYKDEIPRALPIVAGGDYIDRVDPIPPNNAQSFFSCALLCLEDGLQYFGRQFDRECWCGSGYTYDVYGTAKGCDCDGLNIGTFKQCIYKVPDATWEDRIIYLGCYNDVGNRGSITDTGRALPHLQDGNFGSIDECEVQCRQEYYDLFALQYDMECWCGTAGDDDPYKYGPATPSSTSCTCDSVTSIGSDVFCLFALLDSVPIPAPSASPSAKPTASPTKPPTKGPTPAPTKKPTPKPTPAPTS